MCVHVLKQNFSIQFYFTHSSQYRIPAISKAYKKLQQYGFKIIFILINAIFKYNTFRFKNTLFG
jgi:hypothetical protein